ATTALHAGNPGLVADLVELAVAVLEKKIVRIFGGEVGHVGDVALGDEKFKAAAIVDVLEWGMPGRPRPTVAAGIGVLRDGILDEGDVGIIRARPALLGDRLQRLQLVVGHAGEEVVGVATAAEVVAGNPHAPDLERLPAFRFAVEGRRLAGI